MTMREHILEDFLDIKVSIGPSFSPDGSKIAYLNDTPGAFQLYLTDTTSKETKQLTALSNGLQFCSYSPTQNTIIYGVDVAGNEQTQLFLYDVETDTSRKISTNDKAIYKFGDWSKDGKLITYVSNEINGVDFDVYVKKIAAGETQCIFNNGGWCESLGFSPDNSKVVVQQSDSVFNNNLLIIDTNTLSSRLITSQGKKAYYASTCWLKDSSGFYLISNEESDFIRIDYYDVANNNFEIFKAYNWDVEDIKLSPNDQKLAVLVNEGGHSSVKIIDTESKQESLIERLPTGMPQSIRWSPDSGQIVFSFETSREAAAIWTYDTKRKTLNKISEAQHKIKSEQLFTPELIQYASFDGLSIPALLYLPKQSSRKKVPIIVFIHGGPEDQYRPVFDNIFQFFLHMGYAVVAPNVRGSSGYGRHYMSLDDRDKRLDSVQDIVYVKKYLESRKEIDIEKVILMGRSYGGYMVLANLAFYPEHWVAGVDIVGMANLVTFLQNTSPWRRARREVEYGSLKNDIEMLESISPLNKVSNIVAPLLIVHGANDPRVPLSEAKQIHQQLEELGRDVDIVIYKDEGHGITKLKNRIDAYTKAFEFLEKWVK